MRLIVLSTILILFTSKIYCCTCIKSNDLEQHIYETDLVFKGSLEEFYISERFDTLGFSLLEGSKKSHTKDDSLQYTTKEYHFIMIVEKIYKGNITTEYVDIHSGNEGFDDCKYIFEKGKTYIVFTNNKKIWVKKPTFTKKNKVKSKGKFKIDPNAFETNECYENRIFDEGFQTSIFDILTGTN